MVSVYLYIYLKICTILGIEMHIYTLVAKFKDFFSAKTIFGILMTMFFFIFYWKNSLMEKICNKVSTVLNNLSKVMLIKAKEKKFRLM